MRELTETELKQVSGGNMFLAGAISLVGAYEGGKTIGKAIVGSINNTFSMSTGEAAYYTYAQFKS